MGWRLQMIGATKTRSCREILSAVRRYYVTFIYVDADGYKETDGRRDNVCRQRMDAEPTNQVERQMIVYCFHCIPPHCTVYVQCL